jgi:hypothetical protein
MTHEAYYAYQAALTSDPWGSHDELVRADHIERITNRQIIQRHRQEVAAANKEPKEDVTVKQVDAARARVAHLETQLHEQEAERSKLTAQKLNSTSAEYIVKINATLDVLKDLIARSERELRQAQKHVDKAEQRLEEERTIKERLKGQYVTLMTVAEQEISRRVQEQRQQKLSQVMRSTEAPLIALRQQQEEYAEKVAVALGPETLHELNARIEELKTR